MLRPLDSSLAYLECPVCRNNGTPGVMMTRDMHMFKCQFSHQLTVQDIQRMKPAMTQMDAILVEQPAPEAMAWKIMVLPATREAFEKKFHGRIHITIGTFLQALCEDSLLILSGEDVAKLRRRGITNSAQVVAALEGVDQLERDRDHAVKQLENMMNTLRQAGAGGDGQ